MGIYTLGPPQPGETDLARVEQCGPSARKWGRQRPAPPEEASVGRRDKMNAVEEKESSSVSWPEIVSAYLTEDWPQATELSLRYVFGDRTPERVALLPEEGLSPGERAYLKNVLDSWRVGTLTLFAVRPDGNREIVRITGGLDLAQTGRLVERKGFPLAIYAGPETQGWLVLLQHGEPPEPLLPFTLERLLPAYSLARGQAFLGLYRPPQGFMEGMVELAKRKRLGIDKGSGVAYLKIE